MRTAFSRLRATTCTALLMVLLGMSGLLSYALPATARAATSLSAPSITSPSSSASEPSPTIEVTGTGAAPGATVVVSDNGLSIADTVANDSGGWTVFVDLLAGSHSLTAVQSLSGQQSAPSSAVVVTVASNQLLTNGSFEQPVVAPGASWENFPTGIPGWSPTNACGIELQSQATVGVTPYDGNQYDELESNCVSGIVQTLSTVPNTQYVVSFAYQARPGTPAYMNTISASWGGTQLANSLQGGSNWTVATYTVTATSSSTVLQFNSADTVNPNDSTGGFLDGVSVVPAASLEPANTSWLTAQTLTAPSGSTTANTTGTIAYTGEDLWYDFPIEPDEQVKVSLGNVPADYNIAVFSDISQTFKNQASSTPNLAALGAESPGNAASPSAFSPSAFSPSAFSPSAFSPSAFSPSAFSPSAFSPSAFSPSAFSPSAFSAAYSSAQTDSLLGVSSAAGAVDKSVTADTWNNTGNFYVRISGNNGAASPSAYSLTVTTSGGPCQGVALQNYSTDGYATTSGGTISGAGGPAYKTVIVDNSQLMPAVGASYSGADALFTPLQQLAQATGGVVLDVGQSTQVDALVKQAQTYPGCPYAENLVATAIQEIINTYRIGSGANLQYVVLVGDDGVIPFFRYPDTSPLAGESNYQPPLLSTTAAAAALQTNQYLSDDQYGAANELSIEGTTVPLPSAAVGRLVETPADILATVDSYLGGKQVIKASSSLVTGYDFMQPPASQVEKAFAAGMPQGTNDTLITNDGVPASQTGEPPGPSYSWTAGDLSHALFTSHHDLVFLGGHFSANNLLAADDTTTMTTNQFASEVGTSLENSLVLSAGCHAGYNINAADGVPGVTDGLAWPQAFTEAGATLIAGTGYQYGDTNYTAYSDQVYVDLAHELGYEPAGGPGPVAVGTALLAAKQQYLSSLDQLSGIEEKALLEITLYGLPMLGLAEPAQVPTPGGSTSDVTASPVASTTPPSPGAELGLETASLEVTPTLTSKSVTPPGSTTTYTYDSGPQGVVADPGGPVLPVQTNDVNVAGETLRGVGFWGGSYSDQAVTSPLTGDPATEVGNSAVSPFSSPVFFPQTMWNPNYFSTLLNGGDTQLALTPVQYQSGASGATTDMRTYNNVDLGLFYSNNTSTYANNTPALAAAPTISGVTSSVNGSTVTVSATVTGDLAAGIQDVWVTYTGNSPGDPLYGSWQSVDLTQSSSNSAIWTGTFSDGATGNPVEDTSFMVQAVNGVGEVTMNNNDGYYFTPGFTPGASQPSGNAYSLQLSGPTSGPYLGSAVVSATIAPTPANPTAGVAGLQVTFGLGATVVSGTTNAAGTATVTLPLLGEPGAYSLTASYAGAPDAQPAGAEESFQIDQAPTALSLFAPSQITSGGDSAVTATLTSTGLPLQEKAVYFEVSTPSGTVVDTTVGITNSNGVAQGGPITLPPGDVGAGYVITAYFGSSAVALPGGSQYNATDVDYASSTSSPGAVTVVDPTKTSVTLSSASSAFGQPVTVTAAVSPADNYDGALAAGTVVPAGTVTFSDGAGVLGVVGLSLNADGLETATLTVPGLQGGIQTLSAAYSGSVGFLPSTGSATDNVTFTEVISGTHRGNLSVTTGEQVLITGTVTGSVSVSSGGLEVDGGSIGGALRAIGAVGLTLCGARLGGAVSISGSTGYVLIGGGATTGCGESAVSGALLLRGNTGGLQVATTSVGGSVQVTGNSGYVPVEQGGVFPPTEIAGNTITGALACSGNAPAPTDAGQPNKAAARLGQCAVPANF
ncbi:MAG: Ig-like domain repeat protein [Acidimicrobiales bacterium]